MNTLSLTSYSGEHALKKLHVLFINLQLFTNIPLKTSYVDEQWLKILICYFSCFSSYLSPNFISWWTSALKIHSLFYRIQLLFITLHSLFINLISWRTHMLFSAFQFLTMSTVHTRPKKIWYSKEPLKSHKFDFQSPVLVDYFN